MWSQTPHFSRALLISKSVFSPNGSKFSLTVDVNKNGTSVSIMICSAITIDKTIFTSSADFIDVTATNQNSPTLWLQHSRRPVKNRILTSISGEHNNISRFNFEGCILQTDHWIFLTVLKSDIFELNTVVLRPGLWWSWINKIRFLIFIDEVIWCLNCLTS